MRQVKQQLRGSKCRDLVTVEHMPAATGPDITVGLNDHRPHVVHFSGHEGFSGVLDGAFLSAGRLPRHKLRARLAGRLATVSGS